MPQTSPSPTFTRNRPLTESERDDACRVILSASRLVTGVEATLAHRFLEFNYGNYLNGRWRQGQRWVTRKHKVGLPFHEACKALFCPMCRVCGQHGSADECTTGQDHDICWREVGSAPVREEAGGEGEDAQRTCSVHGSFPWRRSMQYSTVALFTGNKAAKTSMSIAEFCSWAMGYRPWDDTLTAPIGRGRIWMIVCQTIGTSGMATIKPLVERYMGKRVKPIYNSSKQVAGWAVVEGPTAGDIIRLVSHDQHKNTKATVSPLAGINPAGVLWDEPTESEIRTEVTRGLVPAMAEMNWGREIMASTLIDGAPQARAYMRNEVWDVAGNRGGRAKEIFALSGSIYDNPALTRETIRQIVAKWAPWERAARISGIAGVDRGRILSDFDPKIHVWDDAQRDVLLDNNGNPSDWPLAIAVDPHDVRPWVITVTAFSPEGHWHVVREWPEGDFQKMRHYKAANTDGSFEGYRCVLDNIIASIPGGKSRVLWWVMDPGFGDSEKAGMGQTVRKAMMQQGYWFKTDLPREIEPGHAILRDLMRGSMEENKPVDMLHRPHFYVAERCRNVIWSILNYVNDEGNDPSKFREKPGEAGKDFVDTLRYVAMCKPSYFPWDKWHAQFDQSVAAQQTSMRNSGLG